MKAFTGATFAALCALALSGCIASTAPILTDSNAVLGESLKLQLFGLRDGAAHDPERASFKWNGKLYAHAGGGMKEVRGFSLHPFEGGDYILQETPANRKDIIEYAVLHPIADGVYQVLAIDEADADEPTRTAACGKDDKLVPSSCRITTREQLFAFARATATHRKTTGGLAIRLADEPQRKSRR